MSKLNDLQEHLKTEIDGYVASAIVDATEGIPLAVAQVDPNFDQSVPSGFFTATFRSGMKAFEAAGWGVMHEILMPGETQTILLISLKGGRYYQGIAVSSKTPLGMIRAIFNKVKPEIEALCP